MLTFGGVTMTYFKGDWSLNVRLPSRRAKSGYSEFTEYHGSLHRALPAVRYYLDHPKDIARYQKLAKMLRLGCKIFRKTDTYAFADKVEYRIPALIGEHHVATLKNHGGVILHAAMLKSEPPSSRVTTHTSFPGRHSQACDAILSIDIGDKLTETPDLGFSALLKYIEARIRLIHHGLSQATPIQYADRDDEECDYDDETTPAEASDPVTDTMAQAVTPA